MTPIAHTLDNGLRVQILPWNAAPVASAYLWLDAGTADEQPDEAGVAHLLEHMLFKGTARRGIGASAAAIEACGGDLNAYTTYDQTVLHATVEASSWDTAIDVLADMAQHPVIDREELERERLVVLEEIRSYADDPDSVLSDRTCEIAYPGHIYGQPVLGSVASVETLSHAQVHGFWATHWVPNRAVLTVVGPVDPQAVIEAVTQHFADWTPGDARAATPEPAPGTGGSVTLMAPRFETVGVEICWRGPKLGDPDVAVLDVLSFLLGQGHSARLIHHLQLDDHQASEPWAGIYPRVLAGTLNLGLQPLPGRTLDAVQTALRTVRDLAAGEIGEAEVRRARNAILADFLFGDETVDTLAHDLAWYTARTAIGPAGRQAYRDAIGRVTAADIANAARRWLQPTQAHVVVHDPNLSLDALQGAVDAVAPAPMPKVRGGRDDGGTLTHTFANGVRAIALPSDGAVAGVYLTTIGGRLSDTARRAGLGGGWAHLVGAGAGDLDPRAWRLALDDIATNVSGVWGRNTASLQASFPSQHQQGAIDLLGQALIRPRFDADEWIRIRDEFLNDLDTLPDRPGEVASRALWKALWPNHPWRLPGTGSKATLAGLTPATFRTRHRRVFAADNLVVGIAGGVDPDAAFAQLDPWIAALPAHAQLPDRPKATPLSARTVRIRAGREQATLIHATRAAGLHDADRDAWRVLSAWLGGQSGPLFMALRETLGLAYSVWATSFDGLDGGHFAMGLATEPSRLTEANRALRHTLESLAASPPDADTIAETRRMMLGQTAMGLQRASARAADLALCTRYGIPWGYDAHKARLAKVTEADIARLLAGLVSAPTINLQVRPVAE